MIALLVALTAAVLVGYIIYEPRATFDTLWSLNWSRDIWQGGLPNFEAYRVPTQHPLLLAIGLLVQPAGDYAASLMVAWSLIGYIALMIAVYRLGVMAAGVLGGLVAFGLAFKEGDLLRASLTPGLTLGTLGVVAHYIESKRSRGLDRQASSKDSLRFGARFAHQSFVSASRFALSDFMREAFSDFQRATTSALTLVAFR